VPLAGAAAVNVCGVPIQTLVGPDIGAAVNGVCTFTAYVSVRAVNEQPYNVAVIIVFKPGADAVATAVTEPEVTAETTGAAEELQVE